MQTGAGAAYPKSSLPFRIFLYSTALAILAVSALILWTNWYYERRMSEAKPFLAAVVKPIEQSDAPLVCQVAAAGDEKRLQDLLHEGVSIETKDRNGRTPLLFAIKYHQFDSAAFLIRHGANAGVADSNGDTALHYAAEAASAAIAELVVKIDIDINLNSKNTFGETPIMIAAMNGSADVVNVLIHAGADVSIADPDGRTALTLAELSGHTTIATQLKPLAARK